MPTPRPPVGGSEESEQKDQFSAAQDGKRLMLPMRSSSWLSFVSNNAMRTWPAPSG